MVDNLPTSPMFSNSDGTQIDVVLPDGTSTTLTEDDPYTSEMFLAAKAGNYGEISPYVVPVLDESVIRSSISRIYSNKIETTLEGKSNSMLREASFLQSMVVSGLTLSPDQQSEVLMFEAINTWETNMIEKREELIRNKDLSSAQIDLAWPAPPPGLPDFLTGF